MNDYTSVLDFEGLMEGAFHTLLTSAAFNVLIPADVTTLQKARPELYVQFRDGGAASSGPRGQRIIDPLYAVNNLTRDAAFTGTLHLQVVVNSDEKYKVILAQYRAAIRWIIPQAGPRMNNTLLSTLAIQFVQPQGASPIYKPQDGYLSWEAMYRVDFSIQSNALSQFTN
jgi:hypothetical protein